MKKSKLVPIKKRLTKTIPICSRRFDIEFTKELIGGEFSTVDSTTKSGKIRIGEGQTDDFYILTNFIHEVMETVFTIRNLRWADPDQRTLFSMNHDQFADAIIDVTRAIIDSGLITVQEPGVK